jgi:hypothetical protein
VAAAGAGDAVAGAVDAAATAQAAAAAEAAGGVVPLDLTNTQAVLKSVGLPTDTLVVGPQYYIGGPTGPAAKSSSLNHRCVCVSVRDRFLSGSEGTAAVWPQAPGAAPSPCVRHSRLSRSTLVESLSVSPLRHCSCVPNCSFL